MTHLWRIAIVVCLLIVGGTAAIIYYGVRLDQLQLKEQSVSGRSLTFLGDLHTGDNYREVPAGKKGRSGFKALRSLVQSSSFTIANLETPITSRKKAMAGKKYVHWAAPKKIVDILSWFGVDAVALANNHAMDQGTSGLIDTFGELKRADISWIGAGRGEGQAWRPLIVRFKKPSGRDHVVALISVFEYRRKYDKKYRFYAKGVRTGVAEINSEKVASLVRQIRTTDPDAFIVVLPHWGENYKWAVESQKRQARDFVESGVDMVIGHGAHVMQEVELYKNRWILYGIGNSVFNTPGRYQKRGVAPFSFIVKHEFEGDDLSDVSRLKLYPVFSDNLKTNYKPRLVDQKEFDLCRALLFEKSHPRYPVDLVTHAQDEFGFYIELNVDTETIH